MRFFAYHDGNRTPIPFGTTNQYLAVVDGDKQGYLNKTGYVWKEPGDQIIGMGYFLRTMAWLEITPEIAQKMGFKIVPE